MDAERAYCRGNNPVDKPRKPWTNYVKHLTGTFNVHSIHHRVDAQHHGEFLKYHGGYSVSCGVISSVPAEDILSTAGDILSTVEG